MWTSALSYFLSYCLHLHLNERKSERARRLLQSVLSLCKLFLTSVQKAFILSCENRMLFHSRLRHTKYSADKAHCRTEE